MKLGAKDNCILILTAFGMTPLAGVLLAEQLMPLVIVADRMADTGMISEPLADSLVTSYGFMIGFSWEKAFASASNLLIGEYFEGSKTVRPHGPYEFWTGLGVCAALVLVMLPGWRFLILPHALRPLPPRAHWYHGAIWKAREVERSCCQEGSKDCSGLWLQPVALLAVVSHVYLPDGQVVLLLFVQYRLDRLDSCEEEFNPQMWRAPLGICWLAQSLLGSTFRRAHRWLESCLSVSGAFKQGELFDDVVHCCFWTQTLLYRPAMQTFERRLWRRLAAKKLKFSSELHVLNVYEFMAQYAFEDAFMKLRPPRLLTADEIYSVKEALEEGPVLQSDLELESDRIIPEGTKVLNSWKDPAVRVICRDLGTRCRPAWLAVCEAMDALAQCFCGDGSGPRSTLALQAMKDPLLDIWRGAKTCYGSFVVAGDHDSEGCWLKVFPARERRSPETRNIINALHLPAATFCCGHRFANRVVQLLGTRWCYQKAKTHSISRDTGEVEFAGSSDQCHGDCVEGWVGREIVANMISGVVLHLTQPFAQGDWVSLDGTSIDGWVQDVGTFYTKIVQWDKRPIYVPNYKLMSMNVQNNSRMTHRRIKYDLNMRLQDIPKIPQIVRDMQDMINEHEDIDNIQHRLVRWRGLGEYAARAFHS
ncbi:ynaI [Symbiodinium natans]|uniref:YnaI protein n=1 Tax=Symbiodinium natans TaxID=878477 RepID=A0A812MHM0_9DINO|nr:ynaI [Symbiodinium natans]